MDKSAKHMTEKERTILILEHWRDIGLLAGKDTYLVEHALADIQNAGKLADECFNRFNSANQDNASAQD